MNSNELSYWVALDLMPTMWTKRKMEIYVECFNKGLSVVDLFENTALWPELGLTAEEQALFSSAKSELPNHSFMVEELLSQGYSIVPVTYADYPATLKRNLKYNAPLVIYAKGDKRLLQQDTVAIVGSRSANAPSLDFATRIAQKAVSKGEIVVSGFAKGVDRQALDAAVEAGGKSIIVLPQGICTFASGFRQYYKQIAQGNVVVVSTFPPKASWSVALAMARNPIIYAMATKIFVAQSDSSGGTWEGATNGLRKGREIYVRYPRPNEKNANLMLIQQGAIPVDGDGKVMTLVLEDLVSEKEKTKEKITALLKSGEHLSSKEIGSRLSLELSDAKLKTLLRSIENVSEEKVRGKIKFFIARELSLF